MSKFTLEGCDKKIEAYVKRLEISNAIQLRGIRANVVEELAELYRAYTLCDIRSVADALCDVYIFCKGATPKRTERTLLYPLSTQRDVIASMLAFHDDAHFGCADGATARMAASAISQLQKMFGNDAFAILNAVIEAVSGRLKSHNVDTMKAEKYERSTNDIFEGILDE